MVGVDKKKYVHFSVCRRKKSRIIVNTRVAQLKKRKNLQYFLEFYLNYIE